MVCDDRYGDRSSRSAPAHDQSRMPCAIALCSRDSTACARSGFRCVAQRHAARHFPSAPDRDAVLQLAGSVLRGQPAAFRCPSAGHAELAANDPLHATEPVSSRCDNCAPFSAHVAHDMPAAHETLRVATRSARFGLRRRHQERGFLRRPARASQHRLFPGHDPAQQRSHSLQGALFRLLRVSGLNACVFCSIEEGCPRGNVSVPPLFLWVQPQPEKYLMRCEKNRGDASSSAHTGMSELVSGMPMRVRKARGRKTVRRRLSAAAPVPRRASTRPNARHLPPSAHRC